MASHTKAQAMTLWARHAGWLALMVAVLVSPAAASSIDPGDVRVIDGSTIEVRGAVYRLVGFDAPETVRAQCAAERERGATAMARLNLLVAKGGLDFTRVPCACAAGTEGTPRCNDGRLCGVLKAGGRDVGAILMSEGLARPALCARQPCPRRQSFCD